MRLLYLPAIGLLCICLLLGGVTGCVSIPKLDNFTTDQSDMEAKQFKPASGQSRIYILHPYVRAGAYPSLLHFSIDGLHAGMLISSRQFLGSDDPGRGAYLAVDVQPGSHEVTPLVGLRYPNDKDPIVTLQTEENQVYFLRAKPKFKSLTSIRGYALEPIDSEQGMELVKKYKRNKSFDLMSQDRSTVSSNGMVTLHFIRPGQCQSIHKMYLVVGRTVSDPMGRCLTTEVKTAPGRHRVQAIPPRLGQVHLVTNTAEMEFAPGSDYYISVHYKNHFVSGKGQVHFKSIDKDEYESIKSACRF